MAQQRQHATIRMDATLKLMKNYHKKSPPETGKEIKYDFKKMREEPNKLEQWYKEEKEKQDPSNWEGLKQTIQKGQQQCYPITAQTKYTPKPDNLDKVAPNTKWGTPAEKEATEKEIKKRGILQKRILPLDNKLKKDLRKILLAKIVAGWRQSIANKHTLSAQTNQTSQTRQQKNGTKREEKEREGENQGRKEQIKK